jgi:hypothetical protein
MKTTVAMINTYAQKHGASFSTAGKVNVPTGVGHALYLDAPKRKLWVESNCHVSCALHGNGHFDPLTSEDLALTFADVRAIIEAGVVDCDDELCETCST